MSQAFDIPFPDWLAKGRDALPKGERTRRDLMIAGAELLAHQKLEALTVAATCARTGVAHGTFYIHFPNRNALAGAVLQAFVDYLQDLMRAAARGAPDPVRATTSAYMRLFAENAGLMRCLLTGGDALPAAQAAFQRLNHDWAATVAAAARRRHGAAARPEPDLMRRALALGGMVDQYLTALHVTEDPQIIALSQDSEALLDLFTDLWTKGMAP